VEALVQLLGSCSVIKCNDLGCWMMNNETETIIVKTFFNNRIQDRVLYELASPKKRQDALQRLSSEERFLDKSCMIEIPKPNSDYEQIEEILKKHGAGKKCYAISSRESIDGQELPLKTALSLAVGYGMPSLISCVPYKLAYFEGEQAFGPPKRYILVKK
jgi:hypothetical protein